MRERISTMMKKMTTWLCLLCLMAGIFSLPQPAEAATSYPTGYVRTGTLSLRASASSKSETVVKLSKYDNVKILSHTGNWYKVNATHKDIIYRGYVSTKYITLNICVNPLSKGYVQKKASLRKLPESDAKKIVTLSVNDKVTVKALVGKWYKVKVKHKEKYYTGYVLRSYLKAKKVETQPTTPAESKPASSTSASKTESNQTKDLTGATGHVNHAWLNLRAGASTTSEVIVKLLENDKVVILKDLGGWYKVNATHGSKVYCGYVVDWYIDIDKTVK